MDDDRVGLVIEWPRSAITPYTGVLVEMWDKRSSGRARRRWLSEFTEGERKTIGRLYRSAYDWVLRTGHPDRVQMSGANYALLVRAANFFGSL